MGECFFYGGKYGLYGGNQQYTVRSFEFVGQTTASICLIWDWGVSHSFRFRICYRSSDEQILPPL